MQTVLRPAGFNERRCIARDTLSLYGTIVTVGVYFNDDRILSREDVYKALKDVITRQPVLSTVVQNSETEAPQLARASSIDLSKHVDFRDPAGDEHEEEFLQAFLESIHAQPLEEYESRPQWRVHVAPVSSASQESKQKTRIAFASSHAICDGASGLVFHRALLDALRGLETLPFSSDAVYEPGVEPKLLPPLEEIANFTISWSFLLGPLLAEYLPRWATSMLGFKSDVKDSMDVDRAWTGAEARPKKKSPAQLPPTAVEYVAIPPQVLQSVLVECRKHDCRLTGLLNHLATRSLARALHIQGEKYGKFVVDTAIDLRRCLPQLEGQMGNFVSASMETMQADPEQLDCNEILTAEDWRAVAHSTEQLSKASQTLADQPIALLKYLSKFRDWTLKNASTPAKGAFGMSNIGNFAPGSDPDSSWTVEEMIFSQSADCTNAPFNLNVASAKGGNLWLVLSWWPGVLGVRDERRLMKETCEGLLNQLTAIASGSVCIP